MKKEITLLHSFISGIMPKDWIGIFTVDDLVEKENEWNLLLTEKAHLVPEKIKQLQYSLNGYCKPIELMSFPFGGRPVYIKIRRRRWIIKGDTESYCNTYDLHYPGIKATKPFADFLKELDRESLDEFLNTWPMYRSVWEKDTSLVQRLFKWFFK